MNCGAIFFAHCSGAISKSCGVSTYLFYIFRVDTHLKIPLPTSPDNQGWFFVLPLAESEQLTEFSHAKAICIYWHDTRTRKAAFWRTQALFFLWSVRPVSSFVHLVRIYGHDPHSKNIKIPSACEKRCLLDIPKIQRALRIVPPSLIGVHYCLWSSQPPMCAGEFVDTTYARDRFWKSAFLFCGAFDPE